MNKRLARALDELRADARAARQLQFQLLPRDGLASGQRQLLSPPVSLAGAERRLRRLLPAVGSLSLAVRGRRGRPRRGLGVRDRHPDHAGRQVPRGIVRARRPDHPVAAAPAGPARRRSVAPAARPPHRHVLRRARHGERAHGLRQRGRVPVSAACGTARRAARAGVRRPAAQPAGDGAAGRRARWWCRRAGTCSWSRTACWSSERAPDAGPRGLGRPPARAGRAHRPRARPRRRGGRSGHRRDQHTAGRRGAPAACTGR